MIEGCIFDKWWFREDHYLKMLCLFSSKNGWYIIPQRLLNNYRKGETFIEAKSWFKGQITYFYLWSILIPHSLVYVYDLDLLEHHFEDSPNHGPNHAMNAKSWSKACHDGIVLKPNCKHELSPEKLLAFGLDWAHKTIKQSIKDSNTKYSF